MRWERRTPQATLTLKESGGAIESLVYQGHRVLNPSETLFLLKFKRGECVKSTDFQCCSDDGKTLSFSSCGCLPGLEADVRLCTVEETFRVRLERLQIPDGLELVRFELPILTIPDDYLVLDPVSEGRLIPPEKRFEDSRNYDISDYWGRYPGLCQVQFIAAFNENAGIRFFARDRECRPKRIMAFGKRNCTLHIEVNEFGKGRYSAGFDLEFSPFLGDWQEAARPYRDWVFSSGVVSTRPIPEWVRRSPVFITYGVRGEGNLSNQENCFIPYINALPHLMKIAEATDSVILAMLMRWDARGPWTPVAQWPPVGGEDSFRELVEALQQRGHLVGLYGSGISWTTHVYSNDTDFLPPHHDWLALNRDGTPHEWDFKPFRRSLSLCLSSQAVRDYIADEVLKIASSGIDLFQLYDQDFGGQTPDCHSSGHSHQPAPGAWQIQCGQRLQESLVSAFRENGLQTALGGESAAAEPYLKTLQVNDLRIMPIGFVPLYSYIFHEVSANFSGNQCFYYQFDAGKSPENLCYRTALGFACGAMLTVPMRKDGEVDWGAGAPWTMPKPPQEDFLGFVRRLNALRREYPQFLLEGRMEPVRKPLKVEIHTLHLAKGESLETPAVLATNWQAKDGSERLFLVNWLNSDTEVVYGEQRIAVPALSAVTSPVNHGDILLGMQ